MDLTRSAFHSLVLWLIRSATLPVIRLGFCRLWSGQLNQSEYSKDMSLPFPIHHLPFLNFWLSYLIKFLQNQEWWGLGTHSWTEQWGKHLALKVLAKRDWGLWLILQNCFASIVWFMRLNFLKPKPPSFLFRHNLSQCIIWSFLIPCSCPHQKFLMTASKFLHMKFYII